MNIFDPYSFESTFHHPPDFPHRSTFRGRPFHSCNPIPPPLWSPSNSWERPPWRRFPREGLRGYSSYDAYGSKRSHSDVVREACARRYGPYHEADAHWVPRTQRCRNRYHRQRSVRFPWSYYSTRNGGEGGTGQRPAGSAGEDGDKTEEAYEVEEPDTEGPPRKGSNADGKKPEKSYDGHPFSLRPRVRCIVSPEEVLASATYPTRSSSEPSPTNSQSPTHNHHHSSSSAPNHHHSNHGFPFNPQSPSSSSSLSTSSCPISEPAKPPFPHASDMFQINKAQRALQRRRKALRAAQKESDKQGRKIEQRRRQLLEMEMVLREAEQRWREKTRRLEDEERELEEEETGLGDWRLGLLVDGDEASERWGCGGCEEGRSDENDGQEDEEKERSRRTRMEWRYEDGDAEAEKFWVWDEDIP